MAGGLKSFRGLFTYKGLVRLNLLFVFLSLFSCVSEPSFPKPKAYFALSYPAATYKSFTNEFYQLPLNDKALIVRETPKSIEVYYPALNASLFLNYTPMEASLEVLEAGIESKLSEHQKKANSIVAFPYENPVAKKEGVLYEIRGNAASAAQFYITDSQNHFLSGALYFNIKPQYDSIYPAAQYILNDLRNLMGELSWEQ